MEITTIGVDMPVSPAVRSSLSEAAHRVSFAVDGFPA